ncbi:DUF7003 family protein [Flavobacterium psychrotrophum]|uniref:DUF7003 family protein n=1 Tax=Flavobacterium psychrotrophum TaxID=2294119 RepID=UPI000E322ED8|nr:hypothetical protein [Flavobacterium psychrotrophum]
MKQIIFLLFSIFMQAQSTIPEHNILNALDYSNTDGLYTQFIPLGHPYCYLIDCRLNIFRSDNGEWAIAAEKLGYNPRSGYVELEIYYYGNCLKNLEEYNGSFSNSYIVFPIDIHSYESTTDGEVLKPDAKYWLVRGEKVQLTHNKLTYKNAGIELKEYEPGEINIEEAGRLTIINYHNLFRATDAELYKCIPKSLKKIMVLDTWYHRDYDRSITIPSTDNLKKTYELNKSMMEKNGIDVNQFLNSMKDQNNRSQKMNEENYNINRPSSYETWQLIAKVISQNNPALYKPMFASNTHWKNWPESGSL